MALSGKYICIWRKEEMSKVLIHELIHYLNLDMFKYQNKFIQLYDKINLKSKMVNPNEAYTELLALTLMSIWEYYFTNSKYNLNNYINNKLNLELSWSYYQISKILKYFKCYNSFNDLFKNNCTFRQETNVLSYFILKTYFLQNINIILKNLNINNLYINNSISEYILKNTNLHDDKFNNIINNILKNYQYKYDNSLRMTFNTI